MATLAGTQRDLMHLTQGLVDLEHLALQAIYAALERVDGAHFRQRLLATRDEREQRLRVLCEVIQSVGGTLPGGGGVRALLAKGRVALVDVMGGDRAIVSALHTSEADVVTAYERCVNRRDLPLDLRIIAGHAHTSTRDTLQWLQQRVALLDEEDDFAASQAARVEEGL